MAPKRKRQRGSNKAAAEEQAASPQPRSPENSEEEDAPLGLNDSDFDSSDVDAVLMSMGPEKNEAAKMAKIWQQRRRTKRRKEAAEELSSGGEEEAPRKARSSQGGKRCQANEDVRELLAQGQAEFVAGHYDEAIKSMHAVIQQQPDLADPYHVLALIYDEKGDVKKALDAMLLSAYLTAGAESRPVWRRVAVLSKRQGLLDQACYAYKRSLGQAQAAKSDADLESMWELSQIYFQKGSDNRGLDMLYMLYKHSNEDEIACEIARRLVELHRWSECQELLSAYIDRGRKASPPRLDPNAVNMFCEVLLEVRDFGRCANLLLEVFGLRGPNNAASVPSLEGLEQEDLAGKLQNCPVDLVAKLGVALCRTEDCPEDAGSEALLDVCFHLVLSQPGETHHDLQLSLVDALIAGSVRGPIQQGQTPKSARQARRALQVLEQLDGQSGCSEDLRERRAGCLLQLGRTEEAALLLEEVLEDSLDQSEGSLRDLRVKIAEAWLETGSMERADRCLGSLTYEDLKRGNHLPPALSAGQRRARYEELVGLLDRVSRGEPGPSDTSPETVARFVMQFRNLIYDCELDFERLTHHTSNLAASAADAEASAEAAPETPPRSEAAPQDKCPPAGEGQEEGPEGAGAGSSEVQSPGAFKSPEAAGKSPGLDSIVSYKSPRYRKSHEIVALQTPSVINKMKRRHIGLESIEDLYGIEAYLSFVLRGVDYFCKEMVSKSACVADHHCEVAKVVELCEMILNNRRLIAVRNPVKRRMMRALALRSVSLAFQARLWRIVFKHLRSLCDHTQASDDLVALFTRILFTHADADALVARKDDHEGAKSEKAPPAFSASGHRCTYASAFTDVRAWALRKLLRQPRSFGLTLLCGHFCAISSQHTLAVPEYCRAHRLAPHDPLTALCTGSAYISFAMSRAAVHRHDLVLKGFSFLQHYASLRVERPLKGGKDEEELLEEEAKRAEEERRAQEARRLMQQAEADYNLGRGFHQLSIYHLAVEMYKRALSLLEEMDAESLWRERADVHTLRNACGYNLGLLFRAQGQVAMASQVLWRTVVF